jgi:16S rRNA U1498 N3-methylase RsmE
MYEASWYKKYFEVTKSTRFKPQNLQAYIIRAMDQSSWNVIPTDDKPCHL